MWKGHGAGLRPLSAAEAGDSVGVGGTCFQESHAVRNCLGVQGLNVFFQSVYRGYRQGKGGAVWTPEVSKRAER